MLAPEADPRIASDRSAPRLHCLLLCDLADSTALIERLGDARAADLMRQHDRTARDTLQRHHGREIDKTDGFLILFERPIEAVGFALDYQAELARIGAASGFRLRSRVGIHVGEILSWRNADADIAGGAKPIEVEGLAKAIAARLMALADPGQILLSESAYSLALRARAELPVEREVKWKEHGRYRLHGVAAPLPVFEVAPAAAPLQAPRDKIKARRVLPWYRWKPLYALLLVLLVAAPLWYALKPAPAIAFVERDWIVVGDLRNLTGDTQFDLALDNAIRLGLEQSRHVNVIGLPRQRQLLQQLGREASTRVDRQLGSEVAQRLGARAVLLATLSQGGGRLRFTTEVVDPQSEVSVYSRSAEIDRLEQVVPAVDAVIREVRSDLGEAITQIDQSSIPLAKAITPSLDALRAYSVGVQKESVEMSAEARQAFELALSLDPQFASAEAGLARYWYWTGDAPKALAHFQAALGHPQRLTERQRLSIEAVMRSIQGDPTHFDRWKALLAIYPDHHPAAHNLALFHWHENRLGEALRYAEMANTPQSPTAVASGYVAAMAATGLGDAPRARALFEASRAAGGDVPARICAAVAAGAGDAKGVEACLATIAADAPPAQRADAAWLRAALAREAGDNATAARELVALEALLDQLDATRGPALRLAARVMRLHLEGTGADAGAALQALAPGILAALADGSSDDRRSAQIVAAVLAHHALRFGQTALFDQLLAARPSSPASPYAGLLWEAVAARSRAGRGDPGAIVALQALQGPDAPLLVALLLVDALREAGRDEEAEALQAALRQRRAAAFVELGESYLLLDDYLAAMAPPRARND